VWLVWAVVRGLDRRREEEIENEVGSAAAATIATGVEAKEGASDRSSTLILLILRTSNSGGGESDKIVELSIEKH